VETVNIVQAAARIGCSRRTVHTMLRDGRLEVIRRTDGIRIVVPDRWPRIRRIRRRDRAQVSG
jgi:predicted site-specific integrase-resolvase